MVPETITCDAPQDHVDNEDNEDSYGGEGRQETHHDCARAMITSPAETVECSKSSEARGCYQKSYLHEN
jgi:hypothetical protein